MLVPLHRLVQGFVDRRFFRSRFDYPAALELLRDKAKLEKMSQAAALKPRVKFSRDKLVEKYLDVYRRIGN